MNTLELIAELNKKCDNFHQKNINRIVQEQINDIRFDVKNFKNFKKNNIECNTENFQEQINRLQSELKNHFENTQEQIETLQNELTDQVEDIRENIEKVQNELTDKIDDIQCNVEYSIDYNIKRIKEQLNNSIIELEEEIKENKKLIKQLNNSIIELEEEIKENKKLIKQLMEKHK
jgi:phage-related protein